MTCETFRQALPAILLREVGPEALVEAKIHAAGCAACGGLLAGERALDEALARAAASEPLPRGLEARARGIIRRAAGPPPALRLLAAAAAMLLLAGGAGTVFLVPAPAQADELLAAAAAIHRGVVRADLPPCCAAPEAVADRLPRDLPLGEVVSSLARRGYRLAGGDDAGPRLHGAARLSFRRSDLLLTCLMLRDPDTALPASARRRTGSRDYFAWRAEGLTHIVQRLPGGRLCILTSELPEADMADLVLGADAGTVPAPAAARVVRLRVSGMSCDLCAGVVRATLEALPGVARAIVSFPDRTAEVGIAADGPDAAALAAALSGAGFGAEEAR